MHIFHIQVEDGINHVFLADFGLGRLLSETRVFGTVTKITGAPGFQVPDKLEEITIWTHIQ